MNIKDINHLKFKDVIGCAYNKYYKHGIEFYKDGFGSLSEYENDIFIADGENNIMKNFDCVGPKWEKLTIKRKKFLEL